VIAGVKMYSQFFILNPKGDPIIFRDYRGDVTKSSSEIFFRQIVNLKSEVTPIFNLDGINFIYIKHRGLYFTFTTIANVSPSLSFELLTRITKLVKDYCGILSEESIRKNFVLIYELLDEILDYGYPQGTSTEMLKAFVFNEPAPLGEALSAASSLIESVVVGARKSTPSIAAMRPVMAQQQQSIGGKTRGGANELFVDLVEQLTVLFGSTGNVLRSEIDGSIVIKSYLKGNPEVRLALNEDLVFGNGLSSTGGNPYGAAVMDDYNFHECANTTQFDLEKTLAFAPPEGEFTLMNYRISTEFRVPFRLLPFVEEVGPNRIDVIVKVRADMPDDHNGNNVVIKVPVPKSTSSCSNEMDIGVVGQTAEYKSQENVVVWTIKKFKGGSEQLLRVKITLQDGSNPHARKEIGPISMDFDIPMFNCSNIQIRFLRVMERNKNYQPHRWIRYITLSKSYICRI